MTDPDTVDQARDRYVHHRDLEHAAAKLGTENQRERYAAGMLPEDELLALARGELFKPFDGFKRWGKDTKVRAFDIRHRSPCVLTRESDINFEVTQAGELTHDEWVVYKQIGEARDYASRHAWLAGISSVVIEPLAHFATCPACDAESTRMSAKVTIEWAGRKLVREYVLR